MNIKKIIREVIEDDGLDWIRDIEPNPWFKYNCIEFDVEPTAEEINKYIEMCLNHHGETIGNYADWTLESREDDIDDMLLYYHESGSVYLAFYKVLFYSDDCRECRNCVLYSDLVKR